MIDKLCILQGSCSELHCSVALVCDTKMVIAMFGLACVHAAASMYARDHRQVGHGNSWSWH